MLTYLCFKGEQRFRRFLHRLSILSHSNFFRKPGIADAACPAEPGQDPEKYGGDIEADVPSTRMYSFGLMIDF